MHHTLKRIHHGRSPDGSPIYQIHDALPVHLSKLELPWGTQSPEQSHRASCGTTRCTATHCLGALSFASWKRLSQAHHSVHQNSRKYSLVWGKATPATFLARGMTGHSLSSPRIQPCRTRTACMGRYIRVSGSSWVLCGPAAMIRMHDLGTDSWGGKVVPCTA